MDWRIDPDAVIVIDDVDLDEEPIILPDGTVLDEAAAEEYGRRVADAVWAKRHGQED